MTPERSFLGVKQLKSVIWLSGDVQGPISNLTKSWSWVSGGSRASVVAAARSFSFLQRGAEPVTQHVR